MGFWWGYFIGHEEGKKSNRNNYSDDNPLATLAAVVMIIVICSIFMPLIFVLDKNPHCLGATLTVTLELILFAIMLIIVMFLARAISNTFN